MFTNPDFRRCAQPAGARSNCGEMESKLNPDLPPPAPSDRRSGADRRRADVGPPGKHERRRGVESRKPEVVELDMSNSEWTALTQDPSTPGS